MPPVAPFVTRSALWLQVTGTLCTLKCTHCLNASGADEPWLAPLDGAVARRALAETEALGVREVYFTGGEPFLREGGAARGVRGDDPHRLVDDLS